ncbi:hypothetical protein CFK37_16640 [Virgibacillus phasianinus]|uniref:Uncharacterized protein n=1 Tax=Virgibacillus phasianinus TaxID=2017483 RepID=A0A220U6C0_9BACI|nr:hypothetical protein [Virgibacillus phasianinus]ASK63669.1 hypothetical protein CFK37_16640 [Virgibacillus phasianinus]
MTWVYLIIAVIIIVLLVLLFTNKNKNPNHDSSLTMDEKEELREDYLTHGGHDEHEDNKNI